MTMVGKEEFFRRIRDERLDVHPRIITRFPYTSNWEFHRMPSRPLFGATVDRVEGGKIVTEYFVAS